MYYHQPYPTSKPPLPSAHSAQCTHPIVVAAWAGIGHTIHQLSSLYKTKSLDLVKLKESLTCNLWPAPRSIVSGRIEERILFGFRNLQSTTAWLCILFRLLYCNGEEKGEKASCCWGWMGVVLWCSTLLTVWYVGTVVRGVDEPRWDEMEEMKGMS